MLTLVINRMNIKTDKVKTSNKVYLPLVLRSSSRSILQLKTYQIKSKVCKMLQCKIKASIRSNHSQRTSNRGVLNSLTRKAIHSLNNTTILKINKSISIKARLIRPVASSVLMQSHIHNINIKHLFSNLIRKIPNQFSRGNLATTTISSSRPPQARLNTLLKGTTLTGVVLTLVKSTWVSLACS